MLKHLIILAVILMFPIHAMCQCVSQEQALGSWRALYDQTKSQDGMVTTLECDPCKCMTSLAACYAFMAQREEAKEKYRSETWDLLDRALKFGICK